jgi:hypothetical protein
LEENDPRKHDVFKQRIVEISTLLNQANEAVTDLNLVRYVEIMKRMIHKISRLVQLTETYLETGVLPEKKKKEQEMSKRKKIEEQFDEWKNWVKEHQTGLEFYEPIQPYIEDKDRQNRLAKLVKKLKETNKEKR